MKFSDTQYASKLGLHTQCLVWEIIPRTFAVGVLNNARRVAKIASKLTPGLSHSQALDAVSRACGARDRVQCLAMR